MRTRDYKASVLNHLYRTGGGTRQEIMGSLQMRLNNIVAACNELLASGEIVREDTTRLRNVKLHLHEDRFMALGAEHATETLRLVLLDCRHREHARGTVRLAPELSGRARLERIALEMRKFLRQHLVDPRCRLVSAGFADVAIFDKATGRSIYSAHVKDWVDQPVREVLQRSMGVQTAVMTRSDAGCCADVFRERPTGPADNLLYLVVHNGIGSCLILGGRPLHDFLPSSGEMQIAVGTAGSSSRVMLESVSSTAGMTEKFLALHPCSTKDAARTTWRDIDAAARRGDAAAADILRIGGGTLGIIAANLAGFVGVDRIIVNCEVDDSQKLYRGAFETALRENIIEPLKKSLSVAFTDYDEFNNATGAAIISQNEYFSASDLRE